MKTGDSGVKINERVVISERRRARRLKREDEVTLSILSGGNYRSKEKIIYTMSKDISACGARIQSHRFLPVDTLLNIKVALNNPPEIMTALGKVKWIKSLFADEFYEAGLELNLNQAWSPVA